MASLPPERIAAARHAGMQRLARTAATVADRAWLQVDPADIVRSWVQLVGRPLAALIGAQASAAQTADMYVGDVLAAEGADVAAAGQLVASRLAGIASDGRLLESLLQQPAIRSLQAIGAGATPADALTVGRLSLDMIVRTQVADAGRVAAGVAIAARPQAGYTRMLSGKSCSRCVVLAGKWYRWNAGFQRHPRCDCIHVPATKGFSQDLRVNPRGYFNSLPAAEQDHAFTKAGAQAIRDGADVGQVVNARRGMQTASIGTYRFRSTTEGTTVRGQFGRARRDGRLAKRAGQRVRSTTAVRLMPEQIYLEARGDRDEAIRLLRLHGYLL